MAPLFCARRCDSDWPPSTINRAISGIYCSNWNRRRGGYPASNSNNFMRGTETSLQTFRMFISSVGVFQSLFDSQVTCTQVVCFSQEHTFSGRPAASSSSVRYEMSEFVLAIL